MNLKRALLQILKNTNLELKLFVLFKIKIWKNEATNNIKYATIAKISNLKP